MYAGSVSSKAGWRSPVRAAGTSSAAPSHWRPGAVSGLGPELASSSENRRGKRPWDSNTGLGTGPSSVIGVPLLLQGIWKVPFRPVAASRISTVAVSPISWA